MNRITQAEPAVIPVPAKAEFFASVDGQSILHDGYTPMYSADGKVFHQTYVHSYAGGVDTHHIIFEDGTDGKQHHAWRQGSIVLVDGEKIGNKKYGGSEPSVNFDDMNFVLDLRVLARLGLTAEDVASNKPGNIRRMGTELVIAGTEMRQVACPAEITYHKLPILRETFYLARLKNKQYIYVSKDRYDRNEQSAYRIYMGDGASMRQIRICSVRTFLDGGSIYIDTDEGRLKRPASEEEKPTWNDQKLTELDLASFEITESESSLTLAKLTCCKCHCHKS